MKFFEDEFIKIFNNTNINCFGNSCYLDISKNLYAKVEFITGHF